MLESGDMVGDEVGLEAGFVGSAESIGCVNGWLSLLLPSII